MAELMVLYKTPKDAADFDKHYTEKHIPLVKKVPGLRRYELSQGQILTPSGPSSYHLIASLHFDDMAALQKALECPEGRAAHADTDNLGPADFLFFNSREI